MADAKGQAGMTKTLSEMAVEVLTTADGRAKTALSHAHANAWRAAREAGTPIPLGEAAPPQPKRESSPGLPIPTGKPMSIIKLILVSTVCV